jgi:hypothetical protein
MAHKFISFRNGVGSACCGPVTVYFNTCPRLPGMRFIEIEYIPRVKRRVISEEEPENERNMTDLECTIADAALDRMHDQAMVVFA